MNSSQRRMRKRVVDNRGTSHLQQEVLRDLGPDVAPPEIHISVLPFEKPFETHQDVLASPMQEAVKKVNANVDRMKAIINKETNG